MKKLPVKKVLKFIIKLILPPLLMLVPMGVYIFVLKYLTKSRFSNYAGLVGTNPRGFLVGDGILLINLHDMEI